MEANVAFQPLRALVDAERGISYGIVQPGQHRRDGVPIVRVTDIRNGRISTSDPLRVDPAIAAKYRRTTLRGGELLLTLVGTVGETAIVPEELEGWNTARAVGVIPVLSEPGARWVHYALHTGAARAHIERRLNTTVQATLNLSDVSELPIPMPDRAVRERILDILGTLDDKIELNRRMNETLEAMARALFKSWFVDFDPVRAKAEGRAPSGMDAETAKLFPSEFVDSELGMIPKGWRAASVGDCVTLKRGTTYKGMLVGEPGPALLGLGSIRPGGGFRSDGFKTYGGECPPELMLRPGELYVSLKGATKDGEMIGSVARVPKTVPSGRLTQDTVKLEIQNGRLPRFLYRLLLTPEYRTYCANRAMGSAVVALSREDFLSYPLTLPDAAVLERFDSLLGSIEDRGEQNDAENVELAKTRDFLLPRLLSGELSVDAAEREVEAVA